MDKINSSIHNNPFTSYYPVNHLEKDNESTNKIQEVNKTRVETNDSISLSDQAKKLLEKERLVEEISQQLEAAASSTTSPYDELTKCLEIASRIMKGDKVPQTDLMFLAEKEPKLYANAIMMKQNIKNPKHHKSILEDEHDQQVIEDSGKAEIQEALTKRLESTSE